MTNGCGILVADSDQYITKITNTLKIHDVRLEIDPAKSEQKCLEKLKLKPIDILIIYHHPPVIDAIRLLRTIKRMHLGGEILIITLPSEEKIANQSIIEGASAYFINTSNDYQAITYLIKRMLSYSQLSQKNIDISISFEKKLKILERFTSFLSHELKNTFTTIHNALYFLNKKVTSTPDPVFQKYIPIIQNEIIHSNTFLSNLTAITQKKLINVSPCQINDILQEAVNQIPVSKKIDIIFHLDSNVPLNLIDREQIHFAFLHIIRNAIQAMPEGGKLIIQTFYKNNMITIIFIDQGKGIEKNHLPQIFDLFFTTKIRNVGLGLTFSKTIIESHGGQIFFDSMLGKGTKCTILLPQKDKIFTQSM